MQCFEPITLILGEVAESLDRLNSLAVPRGAASRQRSTSRRGTPQRSSWPRWCAKPMRGQSAA